MEFALVAPLLVMIIMGIIEFGRVMMVQQVLVNAAREGARKAVLPGATTQQVQETISNYLGSAGISGFSTPDVTPDPATASSGNAITITIQVPYNAVSWVPTPAFLGSKTLEAKVVMRKEET